MDIVQAISIFRAQILARERTTATILIRAYAEVYKSISRRIDELVRQIEAADSPSVSWLYEQDRLRRLQLQIEAEIARYSVFAEYQITLAEIDAVRMAGGQVADAVTGFLNRPGVNIAFNRLPVEALEVMVGTLQDGSPLKSLFDTFGPQASKEAGNILVDGLARGRGPSIIARELKKAAGISLNRALTISRTEILRSYREASRETYKQNQNVVRAWLWHADLGSRCCAMCTAMHGSKHSLDTPMETHPRCRCAMVPQTATWRELGIPINGPEIEIESGEKWLKAQNAATQRDVLGNAGYRAFKAGEVSLNDFVGVSSHPRWGRGRYTKSLKEILGARQAVEFYKRAA